MIAKDQIVLGKVSLVPYYTSTTHSESTQQLHCMGLQDSIEQPKDFPHRLCLLIKKGIRPFGLIQLNAPVVLEARFANHHYDSFDVVDSKALKTAIAAVYPPAAARMTTSLHMTVAYPGRGRLPGLSPEDANVFQTAADIPTVRLLVTEIHVSRDDAFGSAVVAGIDTGLPFIIDATRPPAHLTLWGNPPVRAGQLLIGQRLSLRNPFIQVAQNILLKDWKLLVLEKKTLTDRCREVECLFRAKRAEYDRSAKHAKIVNGFLERRVVRVQSAVRRWLSQCLARRNRLLSCLTQANIEALKRLQRTWRQHYYAQYHYYSDYDDYADYF